MGSSKVVGNGTSTFLDSTDRHLGIIPLPFLLSCLDSPHCDGSLVVASYPCPFPNH